MLNLKKLIIFVVGLLMMGNVAYATDYGLNHENYALGSVTDSTNFNNIPGSEHVLDKVLNRGVRFRYFVDANGCSYSPDKIGSANFKPACDWHDVCYAHFSSSSRLNCDQNFHKYLNRICVDTYKGSPAKLNACYGIATTYYQAVRTFGKSHYEGKGDPN